MSAPVANRVLPDRSVRELIDYRASVEFELATHIYYLPGQKFIVAPLNGKGMHVELRPVSQLPDDVEDELLGRVVCDNLLWNVLDVPGNLRNRTKADWPLFVASGCRTVKKFESVAIFVTAQTMNSALIIEARPWDEFNGDGRYVGALLSISADHGNIGARLRSILRGVAILQNAEYF